MRGRSVVELLVLGLAFVIGFAVCCLGAAIVVVEIVNPEADTTPAVTALGTLVTGILGAVLGLVGSSSHELRRRPDDEP